MRESAPPRATHAVSVLRDLERVHAEFGSGPAARKLACLRTLRRTRLRSAREVRALHELALFLCACPDSRAVLEAARALLAEFPRRADLRRFRGELEDSGIAGTSIHFRFYLPTAARLARAHPGALHVDWPEWEPAQLARLESLAPLLARTAEGGALGEGRLDARSWLKRGRARGEAEGAFLARRFSELAAASEVQAQLWDELDPPLVLGPDPALGLRTRARAKGLRVCWQRQPLRHGRPMLAEALRVPPRSIRRVHGAAARALVELAQDAMVSRARDLDAFMHADVRDVRLVDCGEGLAFAMLGVRPAQRLPLEAVHAFLTLKNGVPVGYVLSSALFGSCEVAYNVFETWRGAEAAHTYGRVLAMLHALFGAETFTVYPYQLGDHNEEGLRSGAWWFYQKLGFRADERAVLALMRRELARLERAPGQRSSIPTLRRLARANVYWSAGEARADVIGRLDLGRIALASQAPLAEHGGETACAERAAELLDVRSQAGWTAEERQAFERWAPMVLALPGLTRWTRSERRALAEVTRAKGSVDELGYVRAFDRHRALRRALCALAGARSSV